MNPIYDLVVIGLIVCMVLVNLYHSQGQTLQTVSFLTKLREKLTPFNLLGQKTTVRHHASA